MVSRTKRTFFLASLLRHSSCVLPYLGVYQFSSRVKIRASSTQARTSAGIALAAQLASMAASAATVRLRLARVLVEPTLAGSVGRTACLRQSLLK